MPMSPLPPVPEQLSRSIGALYRPESGRVLPTLVRLLGDLDLAEESMHEAFAAALESWTQAAIPDKPRPWLISTARFKAIAESNDPRLFLPPHLILFIVRSPIHLSPAERANGVRRMSNFAQPRIITTGRVPRAGLKLGAPPQLGAPPSARLCFCAWGGWKHAEGPLFQ